jgi:succinate dehydrogenase/fumarate reductase cytochrome b subunit
VSHWFVYHGLFGFSHVYIEFSQGVVDVELDWELVMAEAVVQMYLGMQMLKLQINQQKVAMS